MCMYLTPTLAEQAAVVHTSPRFSSRYTYLHAGMQVCRNAGNVHAYTRNANAQMSSRTEHLGQLSSLILLIFIFFNLRVFIKE